MWDIPDEILWEILSRLPVAPLLRFRCVSKSLKSLIEDQQFIKHHLTHSQKRNSNVNIILLSHHLYSVDFDVLNETNMGAFKELSHPLETMMMPDTRYQQTTNGRNEICGCCHGLLVLRNDEDDDTILWNPSVRRFHEVPFSGIEFPGYDKYIFLGFGHDVVSDDYKLIRIVKSFVKDELNSEVKVYSLKSDSWRRILDIPDYINYISMEGVLANGALHWFLTETEKLNLVAAFDLGTEEFRLMSLPNLAGCMEVVVLGGCLSFIHHVHKDQVDIWVMKEYGVQESWSILFTFDIGDFEVMRPLAYSKCGRKVLLGLDYHVLMWYDLDKKSTDVPMVQMPLENDYDMYTCLQSLVLLNNGTCDFDLVTNKKTRKKRLSSVASLRPLDWLKKSFNCYWLF